MATPQVRCATTKGSIDIVVKPEWSPLGVERFVQLVNDGFFKEVPLFRCVAKFLCQFGYKEKNEKQYRSIPDDVPNESTPNRFNRGYVSFAGNGDNSRDNHLFVTLGENVSSLGREKWETPIGYVTEESMEKVVAKWTTKYGDMAPWGKGPDAGKIQQKGGSEYLKTSFPELDYITKCEVIGAKEADRTTQSNQIVFELAPKLGRVVIELNPRWAPLGVERITNMVKAHFLDEARFFRVVPGFVVQFGMPADPARGKEFPRFKDEPVVGSNIRGTISFATSGPNTRTTQLFINVGDNPRLDGMQFSPIGKVIQGMEFVDAINSEYGEGPDQGQIERSGNEYLKKSFPRLSYIKNAYVGETSKVSIPESGNSDGVVLRQSTPTYNVRDGNLELGFAVSMVFLLILTFYLVIRKLFGDQQPKSKA